MSFKRMMNKLWFGLRSFLFGATIYDIIKNLEKMKVFEDYLLMLVLFGDIFGYPVSSYYRLRLLPLFFPKLEAWISFVLKDGRGAVNFILN